MRPNWDDTFMAIANVMARRSRCSRAQVGAVIVSPSNRILATGYNGPPAGAVFIDGDDCTSWCTRGAHGPTPETLVSYSDCPSIHAEANALLFLDRSVVTGGTLYVSGEVCFTCAKLVANSSISRVVIGIEQTTRAYRKPALAHAIMRQSGLTVQHYDSDTPGVVYVRGVDGYELA